MKQKDFLFGLLGCLVMVCAVFVACSASVENTPEGVATLAINNYVKGTLPDVQEYATEYQHGLLKDWTQETVDYIVNLINNRPRKCLGWKSPAEVFEDR